MEDVQWNHADYSNNTVNSNQTNNCTGRQFSSFTTAPNQITIMNPSITRRILFSYKNGGGKSDSTYLLAHLSYFLLPRILAGIL